MEKPEEPLIQEPIEFPVVKEDKNCEYNEMLIES